MTHLLALDRAVDLLLSEIGNSLDVLEEEVTGEQDAQDRLERSLLTASTPPADVGRGMCIPVPSHMPLLDALVRQASSPPDTPEEVGAFLRANGLDPEKLDLPKGSHSLDATDVGAAIAFGIIGALAPSISVTGKRADTVASAFQQAQDGRLKDIVESAMGSTESELIDSMPGQLHRFADHSHDLARVAFDGLSANPATRVSAVRLVAHLVVDAFGATGIPLPGSTYVREWMGLLDPTDSRVSRLHSKLAAYRHTDLLGAGVTSMGIAVYGWWREIPGGSLRRPKVGIIAHGTCAYAITALAAVNPAFAARRSMLNWASAGLFARNMIALTLGAKRLRAETEALGTRTQQLLDELLSGRRD